ncbi:recombinase family protein [Herbaspirillum rubrisubalbicans]|uniref:Recombinase family protein n=1 Tax=Herbaspirillum rubrisubalbicans TaxID=80842 RepID=A0AAD0XGC9_9BURK|nr:recombinase family protein [Herbaspirillum rubrisubalbicans]AYR23375.1 recombinase family protein [Herbaspirillum rubrisubalbicans]
MIIGYARVSTEDQNLDMQILALRKIGCDFIYEDRGMSGASTDRPGLLKLLKRLRSGDTLAVWRLDRLGRSLSHLIRILENLERRGISFHSISEHIDTRSSGGRLVFHMMAALAEFERALISERTRAGLAAAKAEGKKVGRRPRLSRAQVMQARKLLEEESWRHCDVAAHLGVHPITLKRHLASVAQNGCRQNEAAPTCIDDATPISLGKAKAAVP